AGHGRAFAQKKGCGHSGLLGLQSLSQRALAPAAHAHQCSLDLETRVQIKELDRLARFRRLEYCLDPLSAEVCGKIVFAWIGRPSGRLDSADTLHMVADMNPLQGHADPQSEQTRCGNPATALTNLGGPQNCQSRVRMRNGTERVVRLSPVDDR